MNKSEYIDKAITGLEEKIFDTQLHVAYKMEEFNIPAFREQQEARLSKISDIEKELDELRAKQKDGDTSKETRDKMKELIKEQQSVENEFAKEEQSTQGKVDEMIEKDEKEIERLQKKVDWMKANKEKFI